MKKQLLLTAFIAFSFSLSTVFGQWQPINGLNGGTVNSIAVNGSNIFAGTYSGGVFFSSNGGSN